MLHDVSTNQLVNPKDSLMSPQPPIKPKAYESFLADLKTHIRSAQVKTSLAVNQELVFLYWQIGQQFLTQQEKEGWDSKVVARIAKDLKSEFPDVKGFSRTNLLYMRAFAEAYPNEQIVQQLVGQIPWGHNVRLIEKVKNQEERLWYVQETITNGWSRHILELQIDSGLYQRQGRAVTNFEHTLPHPQSELAQQLIKDPYSFDFLTISQDIEERELEQGLIEHIRSLLIELGVGFAFIGSQHPIQVDNKEYRVDLLFYHTCLHCYIVVDLKMGEFKPEFSGKMNFYVTAVNRLVCSETDNPTIGIILCPSKSKTTVEIALETIQNPIGVSTYILRDELSSALKNGLPITA